MPTQPDNVEPVLQPPTTRRASALGFIRRLGVVVGSALAVSLLGALAFGQFNPVGISDAFFLVAAVLLLIAVIPIVAELGSGITLAGRAAGERKGLRSLLEGEKEKRAKGASRTFLFGLAGILLFALSFVVLLSGS